MESATRHFGHRRTLLNRALRSKVSRLWTLSAAITVLLVLALLTVSPKRFPTLSIQKEIDIPKYRVPEPKFYDDEPDAPNWRYREKAVKQAFLHAYRAYEDNAFPADEVWPLSHKQRQKSALNYVGNMVDTYISSSHNGWGVSIVDAMDTMLLMDIKLEFERAIVHVSTMNFDLPEVQSQCLW